MPRKTITPAPFLTDLLAAHSPSGDEFESQAVFDRYVEPASAAYEKDALGNRIARINPGGNPTLMLAGHLDELGFQISYVDDRGYLYFQTLGGHDKSIISGRRVVIRSTKTKKTVLGVTGKRAIHLMNPEDRKKVPELHEMWIDIGASSKADALKRINLGDTATYDHEFELIHGSIGTARGFDNKVGAYTVGETLIRLARSKAKMNAEVVAVGTAQEEVGVRGATTAAYAIAPQVAIAVDVGHATDHPDCDKRKFGEFTLGGGPMICRGPNINPLLYQRLVDVAEKAKIPYQVEVDPHPTGTDGRAIQVSRSGVATGVVSIPLRYMHTPSEMIDLKDVEATIELLVAFARSLRKKDYLHW